MRVSVKNTVICSSFPSAHCGFFDVLHERYRDKSNLKVGDIAILRDIMPVCAE